MAEGTEEKETGVGGWGGRWGWRGGMCMCVFKNMDSQHHSLLVGVPIVTQRVMNSTNIHEDADLIPGLSMG